MHKNRRYKKTVLENGLTLLTEENRAFYSASIGIWVKCGSLNEAKRNNGVSHFIEHMLFKGTPDRNALDISREVDSIGGEINAFTTSEATCYYMKVLESHLPKAVALLGDIFLNSLIDPEEISNEKDVILQEIKMVEDTPDDLIFDLFNETSWEGSPLSQPVLGRTENIESMDRQRLKDYMERFYTGANVVITAAGSLNHEELLLQIEGIFSKMEKGAAANKIEVPKFSSNLLVEKRRLEQVHLCLGTNGISCDSSDRYAAYLLNTMLGSGMSSRLFQEIREKRGLAYSIYSFLSSYNSAGLLGIYAGASASAVNEILDLTIRELMAFKNVAVDDDELQSAKEQLKGNMVLGLENSESIMQRLAHNEIYFGRDVPVEESIDNIDRVSPKDIQELSCKLFSSDSLSLAVLGNMKKGKLEGKIDELRGLLI
ncbi:MAG: insulinase family protein [Proteobacteria bacterium]|nr:insulinase family protein [Pseudomonadota bacterium]